MKKRFLVGAVVMGMSVFMLSACNNAAQPETAEATEAVAENAEATETEAAEENTEATEAEAAEENTEATEAEAVEENIEVTEESAEGDENAPANEFESRVGKLEFESQEEIIGLLEGDEAYAIVDIKGCDEPVLLVTDSTYDNLDGNRATIDATPYTKKPNGMYTADSTLYSGGTANPLAIDDDGVIYCLTHHSIEKTCYGDNGTGTPAIMDMEYIYIEEFDDNGEPKQMGGFIRTENTVIDNDGAEVNPDDIDLYYKGYEDYEKAAVINFTVADN